MKKVGALGENLVGRWLQLHNHQILKRNWRCRWGELDLIVRHRASSAIAFVEVKTRSASNWDEDGLLAVDRLKQQKLIRTASLFLAQNPNLAELSCRFDVACVSYKFLKPEKHLDLQAISNAVDKLEQFEGDRSAIVADCQLKLEHYLSSAFN